MLSELAIGRSTGFGPVNAYKKVSKKFKWIGWLAIIAPFLIMTFYSVLGGYCIYYMVINVVGMFSGMPDSSSFGALLTNPWASIGCMVLFMLICYLINRGGVGGGIEKFNTIGMPALFVMLVIVIIRAWTLPNADVGLKYMFVPGYAVKAGFFEKAPGFMEVLATAGGRCSSPVSGQGAMTPTAPISARVRTCRKTPLSSLSPIPWSPSWPVSPLSRRPSPTASPRAWPSPRSSSAAEPPVRHAAGRVP